MYAVIKTGGKQYKVNVGDVINVEKLAVNVGDEVVFDEVLFADKDGEYVLSLIHISSKMQGKWKRQIIESNKFWVRV